MNNDYKKKIALCVLYALCCLSVTVMIFTIIKAKNDKDALTHPEFELSAATGIPSVSEELGYSPIEVEQGYKAFVCSNLLANGSEVDIYFTSPETNTVWLMLRITDEKGTIYGQTGIIRPGEYVKTLTLNTVPVNEKNVKLKIIAYKPETYTSMGTVGLNTKLRIGGKR